MNPDRAFVVLAEVTNPVDELGVQCEAVPIVPWSPAGLVDRRWKRRVCRLVPAGPRGHSLDLVVQFDGAADGSNHGYPPVDSGVLSVGRNGVGSIAVAALGL